MAVTNQNISVLNPDGTLNKKFKNQLVDLVNGLLQTEEVQYSQIVKAYVEGQLEALENKLLNNEKWAEVQKNIDALLKVFDSDANGELTPAEVLAKFGELKNSVDKNTADIAALAQKLEDNVKDLTAKVAANTEAISNVKEQVTKLAQDVDNKVAEVKQEATDLVNAVKTELNGKIDTVSGQVTQVSTKVDTVDVKVTGTVAAIEGIAEAFKEAANKIDDRLNEVRKVFGLPVVEANANATATNSTNTTTDNSTPDVSGDGAVV